MTSISKWWAQYSNQYSLNYAYYGYSMNNSQIEPYIRPDITTEGGEHVILTDNGDKNIGKWWENYRILLDVDANTGEYDTDGTLTYSISGQHSHLLYINPTWGNVTFSGGGGADLSTRMEYYNFTVTATSSSHLNPSVSENFTFKIVENGSTPEITTRAGEHLVFSDHGDKNIGKWWEDTRVLLNVDAENGESDTDGTLTYSISGGHSNALYINPIWGNVTFKGGGAADYTRHTFYNFTVTVTSNAHPNASVSEDFTIRLIEGEFTPDFTSSDSVTLDEDNALNSEIYITTVSANPGAHSYVTGTTHIRYSISGDDASQFNVGARTGELSYNGSDTGLDFETQSEYNITVTARAHYGDGVKSGYATTQELTISVADTQNDVISVDVAEGTEGFVIDLSTVADIIGLGAEGADINYYFADTETSRSSSTWDASGYHGNSNIDGLIIRGSEIHTLESRSSQHPDGFQILDYEKDYSELEHNFLSNEIIAEYNGVQYLYNLELNILDVNEGVEVIGSLSKNVDTYSIGGTFNLNNLFSDIDGDDLTFEVVGHEFVRGSSTPFGGQYINYSLDQQTEILTLGPTFIGDANYGNSYLIDIEISDGDIMTDATLTIF